MHRDLLLVLALVLPGLRAAAADWVRPGVNTNAPVWGLREGLLWAIPPAGFRGGEPRGLIRLAAPVLPGGRHDLINFIAIEPVVKGRRGFSELEHSRLDDCPGLRLWADTGIATGVDSRGTNMVPGTMTRLGHGVEQLEVTLRVEPFAHGARVRLLASQRSDRPDEVAFRVHTDTDGAPLDLCILTATMGNLARLRQLWLGGEVISSLKLYPDYRGSDFAPHAEFPLRRLHRDAAGDVLVAATTDEADPTTVHPFPGRALWHYGGAKLTQYWRKPAGDIAESLRAVVNARYTYWLSRRAIPGGVALENFELREAFRDGQQFVFGLTRRAPEELGFTARPEADAPPR